MADQGFDIRQVLRYLTGRRWTSRVLATTEHGTHLFEVIGVEGELDGDTVLRLRTILPEVVEDREGDTWGLQSDGTYSQINLETGWVASVANTGYSLADIEREYGLKR